MKKISSLVLLLLVLSLSFALGEENEKVPIDIILDREPISRVYSIGERINLSELKFHVVYSDYSAVESDWQDKNLIVHNFDNSKAGVNKVNLEYNDGSFKKMFCTFIARVTEDEKKSVTRDSKGVNDIYCASQGNLKKTTYLVGEELDFSGLGLSVYEGNSVYTLYYPDDDLDVRVNNSFSYNYNLYPGCRSVTVDFYYKGNVVYTTSVYNIVFKENVDDKIVTKIQFVDYPEPWNGNGASVDLNGLRVCLFYDDDTMDVVTYNEDYFDIRVYDEDMWAYYYEKPECIGRFESNADCWIALSDVISSKINDSNKNKRIIDVVDLYNQNIYNIGSTTYPTQYNLRDYIDIKTVNQGWKGLCWDFASTKSLETSMVKIRGLQVDLSEAYLDYILSKDFYGTRELGTGGNFSDYIEVAEKVGIPLEEDLPYDEAFYLPKSDYYKIDNAPKAVYADSYIQFPNSYSIKTNDQLIKMMKSHLMEYGSLYFVLGWNTNYINDNNAYYFTREIPYEETHAISIIGWNDEYSKENFTRIDDFGNEYTPKHDGAWIALNSWGDSFGENGVFYISYYSKFEDCSGVLDCEPYFEKQEYTYDDKNVLNDDYVFYDLDSGFDTINYYIEYNKENTEDEYIYNIIFPNNIGNKVYYVDGYSNRNEIDYNNLILLGEVQHKNNILCNYILDEPIKITGDKFTIIIQKDIRVNNEIIFDANDQDIHTYYTEGEYGNDWQELYGDIQLHVYTVTKEQLEAKEDNISEISINKLPNQRKYVKGQNLDLTGGVIKITYKDGTEELKSMNSEDVFGCGFSEYSELLGNVPITVMYKNHQASYNITVVSNVDHIEMNRLPDKVIYNTASTNVDITNGEIKVISQTNEEFIVKLDSPCVSISPDQIDLYETHKQEITINYLGFTTSYEVEVSPVVYASFYPADMLVYFHVGDKFDFDGLRMIISTIENGKTKNIEYVINSEDVELYHFWSYNDSDFNILVDYDYVIENVGDYSLSFNWPFYDTLTGASSKQYSSFNIKVVASDTKIARKIDWIKLPTKRVFDFHEHVEGNILSGGIIKVTYEDGSEETIDCINIDDDINYLIPNTEMSGSYSVSDDLLTTTSIGSSGIGQKKVYLCYRGAHFNYNIVCKDGDLPGDLNYDGDINIIDVRLLLQKVVAWQSAIDPEDYSICDMNEDGSINIIDVRLLLQTVIRNS